MSKAVICPICHGTGKYGQSTQTGREPTYEEHIAAGTKLCHGCGGKGWVEVADNPMPYYPYPTYIPPVYPREPYGTGDPIPYYPPAFCRWD